MNAAQGALALEQLLTDPEACKALQTLYEATPQHIRDQTDAIHRDTTNLARSIGQLMQGPKEVWHDMAAAPEWLRMDLLTRLAAFLDGSISTCRHSPTPDRLQPVFAAACKPNLVTCGLCTFLLSQPRGSAADATCDACGYICTGPEHDDGIYPGMTRFGLLIFMYGTCEGCRPQVVP